MYLAELYYPRGGIRWESSTAGAFIAAFGLPRSFSVNRTHKAARRRIT